MNPGDNLGTYEIVAPIGAGGMGDVYRAHDPKLKRDIAIKVLPEELAADPERRERFEREAVAVAALDHPNIVTVYSVEEAGGLHFITLQLVEGKTLSALIPRQGFSLEEFFELAIPLTDAIAAAHERGITHRDLKPANIMVADDGRVRVLDFGLAKLASDDAAADVATELATEHLTEEGKILGTVAYMSPEQAEGKVVDHRTDIFSLGILMYEMVTGESPFDGDTKLSVMSSIVKDTPTSITDINPRVPRHLGRIIKQTLEKDVARRYQSVLDVRNQLEELRREVASGEVLPVQAAAGGGGTASVRRSMVIGSLAVVAGLIVAAMMFGGSGEVEYSLGEQTRVTQNSGLERHVAISFDGRHVAYSRAGEAGYPRLYTRQIGGERDISLTPEPGAFPRWRPPSGDEIAFVGVSDGLAYVVPSTGGNPRPIATPPANSGIISVAYSSDGQRIAYATLNDEGDSSIYVKSADSGGEARPLADSLREVVGLSWSPNDEWIAFSQGNYAFYNTGNVGPSDVWIVPSGVEEGGEPVQVTANLQHMDESPVWTPDGDLLFVSHRAGGSEIYHQPMRDGTPRGEPRLVTGGRDASWISVYAGDDGMRLAYSEYRRTGNIHAVPILDNGTVRAEDGEAITAGTQVVENLTVSEDGSLVVYDSDQSGNHDIYRLQVGGEPTQLTFDEADDFSPALSPAGDRIAFHSLRTGIRDIWAMDQDGQNLYQLTDSPFDDMVPEWSALGEKIVFQSSREGPPSAWTLSSDPDQSELRGGSALPVGYGQVTNPTFSPDGNFIVYRVWGVGLVVRPTSGGEPRTIASDPADVPVWSTDSERVFFSRVLEATGVWSVSRDGGELTQHVTIDDPLAAFGLFIAISNDRIFYSLNDYQGDIAVRDLTISRR